MDKEGPAQDAGWHGSIEICYHGETYLFYWGAQTGLS